MIGASLFLTWLAGGEPEQVQVPRELTQAEIDDLCKPKVVEQQDQLTAGQDKVATLERSAAEQEGKVGEMEAKMAKNAEAGKAQRPELERLKAEHAATKE